MGASAAIFLAVGVAAGAAATAGNNKTPSAPPAPKPMPLPDDQTVQGAQRRSIAAQLGRRGRASTILTGQDETLGG